MSLASYIGTNIKIPQVDINEDEGYDEDFYVGQCFADETCLYSVQTTQFTTAHVYEISSHWGIEIVEPFDSKISLESKEKLRRLLELMDSYLAEGDYFELYSCWVGEEGYSREHALTLEMKDLDIHNLKIPEKTYVLIKK
ncbi:hypothetical protein D3D03_03365 [Exiguobacterium sp. RIT452]|uniref:hypothetical protein n=1 Tax=Exiguobacterium sp. RIT452 TaxID=2315552 RepID=UPI000E72E06A|nr:hypothetical protein [Exiguobacterium sp. RIT452]RJP02392.1 hypothetical protein D3D03_03365 [Exiguobacterium sp. RIT452]